MNIYNELERLSKNKGKVDLVKAYLLDCCAKYDRFRSSGELSKALVIGKRYLKGFSTSKQIHNAEWIIEGEAFGAEYYSDIDVPFQFRVDQNIKSDLIKIRITRQLTNSESRKYLVNLAYFIDSVFSYLEYTPNGIPGEKYHDYLCPKLFFKYFNQSK